MCIGVPMQVVSHAFGQAECQAQGRRERVNTALVGDCQPGDWLLVHLGSARERIDERRAREVLAALTLLGEGLAGEAADADPGFALPSAMSQEHLAALTGQSATSSTRPQQES